MASISKFACKEHVVGKNSRGARAEWARLCRNGLFPKSLFGLKILRLWKENIGLTVSELKVLVNHREMFAPVPEYKSRRLCSENKALLLTQRWGGIFQKWGPRSYWAPQTKKSGVRAPRFRRLWPSVGDRAFPVIGSHLWNSLPRDVTLTPTLAIFRKRLKTFLFSRSFPP